MRLLSLSLLLALLLLGPPGASSAPVEPAAPAATAPALRLATGVTVRPQRPMAKERTAFTGQIGARGRSVRLEVRRPSGWQVVARGRVGSGSAYRLVARVPRTATYRVVSGAASRQVRVRVAAQSASTSVPAPFVNGVARTVTATLKPVRKGREVALQRRTGSSWTTVVVRRTDSAGVARLPVTGSTVGKATYRVVGRSFHGSKAVGSASREVRTSSVTELVSAGVAIGDEAYDPSISSDGRWVSFTAEESLVPEDVDAQNDIYLFDRVTGSLTLALPSVAGHVNGGYLSATGRFLAFQTTASTLAAGDTSDYDVFVLDRDDGSIDLVSEKSGSDGVSGNSNSYSAGISDDGRVVAYMSTASDLVALGPPNTNVRHAYIRDRVAGVNRGLDRIGGGWATANIYGVDISRDGTRVAFGDTDVNLDPGNVDGSAIFAWDITPSGGISGRVNLTPDINASQPFLDGDGDVVAMTLHEDVALLDNDGQKDAYVLAGGQFRQVAPGGAGQSEATDVTADGRWVAMSTETLAAGDTNGADDDVVVWDSLDASYVLVSRGGAGNSIQAVLGANGSVVAFSSSADDIVAPTPTGTFNIFASVLR